MKYDVKFSCGHTQTVELFGPGAERERKIAYYEQSGMCSECFAKMQAEAIEKANVGLPILEGSEKQVAWAKKIRASLVEKYGKEIEFLKDEKNAAQVKEAIAKAPEHIQSKRFEKAMRITSETTAKWFIENQF
jgi:hypothetical protein